MYASFKTFCHRKSFETGTPAGIRTLDLRLRRPLLYPAELQAHTRPAWPCRNRAKSHTADINVFYQKHIRLSRAKRAESRIICRAVFLTFAGQDCIIDPISAVSGRAAQPCPQKRAASLRLKAAAGGHSAGDTREPAGRKARPICPRYRALSRGRIGPIRVVPRVSRPLTKDGRPFCFTPQYTTNNN